MSMVFGCGIDCLIIKEQQVKYNSCHPMNLQSKSQEYSDLSSSRINNKLISQLHKLSIKALRSSQTVLSQPIVEQLQLKYQSTQPSEQQLPDFIEHFIYTLINQIDKLNHAITIDVLKEDYQLLESAVQKSQGQIRKHLRIQQQLKIYLDSLQQKVEDLQRKLIIEQNKYVKVFEAMREMNEEKKQLSRKLSRYQKNEEIRQKSKTNSNYSTINDQIYREYMQVRKIKASKNKHALDKFNEKMKKPSLKVQNSKYVEGPIQINLSNNIIVSKKSSYDQHLNRNNNSSHDSSIRQLTKTVQMKQKQQQNIGKNANEIRPNRKISKYKTEISEGMEKKQIRSNSVCN